MCIKCCLKDWLYILICYFLYSVASRRALVLFQRHTQKMLPKKIFPAIVICIFYVKTKLNSLGILQKQKSFQKTQMRFPKGIKYRNIWACLYNFTFFPMNKICIEHTNFVETVYS